jgi:hypothetical protein
MHAVEHINKKGPHWEALWIVMLWNQTIAVNADLSCCLRCQRPVQ